MPTVHRTSRAKHDLLGIGAFIARDDPAAAERQLRRIEAACQLLAKHPRAGPRREDLAEGLRFFPVGNYLIFYLVVEEGITVIRIIHGARDYPREFR